VRTLPINDINKDKDLTLTLFTSNKVKIATVQVDITKYIKQTGSPVLFKQDMILIEGSAGGAKGVLTMKLKYDGNVTPDPSVSANNKTTGGINNNKIDPT
jgi:hypothetical protein